MNSLKSWTDRMLDESRKYVVLQGVTEDNFLSRFWTTYNPKKDPTKSDTGETLYKVIGYAPTESQAIDICLSRWNIGPK